MGAKRFGWRCAQDFAYGDYEQSTTKKRTKRERLIAEMEVVVPWNVLVEMIDPYYSRITSKGGRPTYPLETMLKIHLLQQWCELSNPAMEDAMIEVT
jgi:IS5 family transposase